MVLAFFCALFCSRTELDFRKGTWNVGIRGTRNAHRKTTHPSWVETNMLNVDAERSALASPDPLDCSSN